MIFPTNEDKIINFVFPTIYLDEDKIINFVRKYHSNIHTILTNDVFLIEEIRMIILQELLSDYITEDQSGKILFSRCCISDPILIVNINNKIIKIFVSNIRRYINSCTMRKDKLDYIKYFKEFLIQMGYLNKDLLFLKKEQLKIKIRNLA